VKNSPAGEVLKLSGRAMEEADKKCLKKIKPLRQEIDKCIALLQE
jgi:hypothetical protein